MWMRTCGQTQKTEQIRLLFFFYYSVALFLFFFTVFVYLVFSHNKWVILHLFCLVFLHSCFLSCFSNAPHTPPPPINHYIFVLNFCSKIHAFTKPNNTKMWSGFKRNCSVKHNLRSIFHCVQTECMQWPNFSNSTTLLSFIFHDQQNTVHFQHIFQMLTHCFQNWYKYFQIRTMINSVHFYRNYVEI